MPLILSSTVQERNIQVAVSSLGSCRCPILSLCFLQYDFSHMVFAQCELGHFHNWWYHENLFWLWSCFSWKHIYYFKIWQASLQHCCRDACQISKQFQKHWCQTYGLKFSQDFIESHPWNIATLQGIVSGHCWPGRQVTGHRKWDRLWPLNIQQPPAWITNKEGLTRTRISY